MIDGPSERLVMVAAHDIWTATYGSGKSQPDALSAVAAAVASINNGDSTDTPYTDTARITFAVEWIHGGCVTLTTTHLFAAALAASKVRDSDVFDDLPLPAMAFRVQLPNGVLRSETHNVDIAQVNVCILEGGESGILTLEGLGPNVNEHEGVSRRLVCLPIFYRGGGAVASLFVDRDEDDGEWVLSPTAAAQQSLDEVAVRRRMVVLARRIVAGLLLTFAHTTHWSEKTHRGRGRGLGRSGPPPHRVINIGRPIGVDARPAVARYLGGHHAPPSIQTLVRGHHKRQVIGVGRSGRRVIWIEPYWRGPEDAPILARPHLVGQVRTGASK